MRGPICLCWFFLKCVPLTQIQNGSVAKEVWKCYIVNSKAKGCLRSLPLSACPNQPQNIYSK